MNKQDLIDAISSETDTTKVAVGKMINALIEQVQKSVASGDQVKLSGFGTIERATVAARTGRNPKTGAPIPIPAKMRPRFMPGSAFKDKVKG